MRADAFSSKAHAEVHSMRQHVVKVGDSLLKLP